MYGPRLDNQETYNAETGILTRRLPRPITIGELKLHFCAGALTPETPISVWRYLASFFRIPFASLKEESGFRHGLTEPHELAKRARDQIFGDMVFSRTNHFLLSKIDKVSIYVEGRKVYSADLQTLRRPIFG